MAYISQDEKKAIAAQVKAILPKGWKVSFSIKQHSTLICTIREMPKTDFVALGHESSRREVILDSLTIYESGDHERAKRYFDNLVFDDFDGNEFEHDFWLTPALQEDLYTFEKFNAFGKYFAGGTSITPFNITNDRQRKTFGKLMEIAKIMNQYNYDNSDSMSDYCDTGYYLSLNFGSYQKPCKLV